MYFDGKHFLSGRQGDNRSSIWETLASYPSSSRKKRSQPRSPGRNIRRRRRENSSSSRLQRLAISLKKKKKKVDRKYPRNFSRKEAVVFFSLSLSQIFRHANLGENDGHHEENFRGAFPIFRGDDTPPPCEYRRAFHGF